MRVGVKTSTSLPLSAKHRESTMCQQGKTYPSTWLTLVNHQLHWYSMEKPDQTDTDVAAPQATN